MPIHIGTSTKNQQQITFNGKNMQKVYVGDKLVWQKLAASQGYGFLYNFYATQPIFTSSNYGYLYNGYVINDSRNIANTEFHVPSYAETQALVSSLGGASVAGGKMKEIGFTHWTTPNTGANNSSWFTSVGSGIRRDNGAFDYFRSEFFAWDNTFGVLINEVGSTNAGTGGSFPLKYGFSIRLIADSGTPSTYTGNDGKVYQVRLMPDGKYWTIENLCETLYRDKTAIPEVTSNTSWSALTTGARCSYNNIESNAVVTTTLAKTGWHFPTKTEIDSLRTYLGGQAVAGGKLKETGFDHWLSPNGNATNETGFNGRGAGWRGTAFDYYKRELYIGSATSVFSSQIYAGRCRHTDGDFSTEIPQKYYGISWRLIADSGTPTEYVGNDGYIYPTVTINGQTWLAQNLRETRYTNGQYIKGFDNGTYTPISNSAWAALTTPALCVYGDNLTNL